MLAKDADAQKGFISRVCPQTHFTLEDNTSLPREKLSLEALEMRDCRERNGGCWSRLRRALGNVTVEPLMLLDGLAFSNMHVYVENLQMERVCRVGAGGFPRQVCEDLRSYPEASVEVQQRYSVFALYNGLIAAALPLFFILFMGAWSDKYGRKVPLVAVQVGHVLHAGGYLLASFFPSWPAEALLLLTLLDTLGGGTVSFLTAANSYVGDVSSEESRTSRVGLANSIWFLGGPVGTLMGTFIYSQGGYLPLFATSLTLSVMAVLYVVAFLPESHGPFAQRAVREASRQGAPLEMRDSVAAVYGMEVKDAASALPPSPSIPTMIKDFFSPRRILDSFRSTLKRREGNARALVLTLIFTSLLRRLTRSPYVFAFTRHVLGWQATDYSLWVTYKNIIATTGSLVAVPLLSGRLGVSDNLLAIVGSMSGVLEYLVYGCVSDDRAYLIWIAPVAALLLNSCTIAQRAMMTKIVPRDEIGKVSAVLGALDGMMPMLNSALYTALYHVSVSAFPAAHFFLGACASALMIVFFCVIAGANKGRDYDVEGAKSSSPEGPINNKSLVVRTNSCWLATDTLALALSTPDPYIYPSYEAQTSRSRDANERTHKLLLRMKSSLRAFVRSGGASPQDPPPAQALGAMNKAKETPLPKISEDNAKDDSECMESPTEKTLPPVGETA